MTQYTVAIILTIYYSEIIQSKIRNEKGIRDEIRRKPGTGFQEFPLVESQRTFRAAFLQQQVITTRLPNVICHGSSQTQYPRVLLGAIHTDTFSLLPTKNSRLPEGKQVFIKSHTACANILGTVNHFLQFWEQKKS